MPDDAFARAAMLGGWTSQDLENLVLSITDLIFNNTGGFEMRGMTQKEMAKAWEIPACDVGMVCYEVRPIGRTGIQENRHGASLYDPAEVAAHLQKFYAGRAERFHERARFHEERAERVREWIESHGTENKD